MQISERAASLWPQLIVLIWTIGGLFHGIRFWRNSVGAYRLARSNFDPLSESLQLRFLYLKSQLGLNWPIGIGISQFVDSPCMVGLVKPVILLPLSCLTQLSSDELEAVIAHELAHIKRHDVLHRMIQSIIETLFYYHPILSYISKQVTLEREHACDDLAIRVLEDPKPLATGLLKIGLMRVDNSLVMTSTSPDIQALEKRIARIVTLAPQVTKTRLNIKPMVLFIMSFLGILVWNGAHAMSSTASDITKPMLISLKSEICNQFKVDNIYWNPIYDQGGPAKVRVFEGQVFMNDVMLPESTQNEVKEIFLQHKLARHDDIRLRFFGDDIKLVLNSEEGDKDERLYVYRINADNKHMDALRVPARRKS